MSLGQVAGAYIEVGKATDDVASYDQYLNGVSLTSSSSFTRNFIYFLSIAVYGVIVAYLVLAFSKLKKTLPKRRRHVSA